MVHGFGKEHDGRLDHILRGCKVYNITLRKKKCHFGQPRVTWFGYVYNKEGMSPNPEKVARGRKKIVMSNLFYKQCNSALPS